MPFAIRAAEPDDLPTILQIEQQAPLAAHWTFDQYKKLLQSGVVLVAEESGALRGFMCAKAVAGEWEIENIVVTASFQRQGVAGKLLHAFLQYAQSTNAAAILLEVRESNQSARALYEKNGFCQEARRRAYYANPIEDAILYALRSITNPAS